MESLAPIGLLVSFVINLLASIVTVFIVLWLERYKRPRLRFSIGETGEIGEDDPLGRQPAKWSHVNVTNEAMPRWLAWAWSRESAYACRGWITFHHLDGQNIFGREMRIRWSESPEPLRPLGDGKVVIDQELWEKGWQFDIPAGEYTTIDVVTRIKGDAECYGWNNESYLHKWRHPAWKLPPGRYLAKIRIVTAGREFRTSVRIVNDVGYDDFRLILEEE